MATASVIIHQRNDDYAVIQLLTPLDIAVGQSFTLTNVGHGLDGAHTVYALPQYLFIGVDNEGDLVFNYDQILPNQILFYDTGDELERSALIPNGTLTFTPHCTWIDKNDVQDWLGLATVTVDEAAFLDDCAEAANTVAYRKRQESGYSDSLTSTPGHDVFLGTVQLGAAYYRMRGAVDMLAQFSDMTTPVPTTGMTPAIMQLLGVPRPAVA